jgi:hypothetical protein
MRRVRRMFRKRCRSRPKRCWLNSLPLFPLTVITPDAWLAGWYAKILNDPDIEVVSQSHDSFLAGLALYERRPDKRYSLVDCISMNVMRQRDIQEILTSDRHFSQEGFVRLLDLKA